MVRVSCGILLCVVNIAVWHEIDTAHVPFLQPLQIGEVETENIRIPVEEVMVEEPDKGSGELVRARVREGMPPPLCAGRCTLPPAGPVCAFDATGTARTFATLCELEAVSCRESTYYAITNLGEC